MVNNSGYLYVSVNHLVTCTNQLIKMQKSVNEGLYYMKRVIWHNLNTNLKTMW